MDGTLKSFIEECWLAHCSGEGHFPREMIFLDENGKNLNFGMKHRPIAINYEHFRYMSWMFYEKFSVHTAIYCQKCRSRNLYSRLFIDLDGHTPSQIIDAYVDMKKLCEKYDATSYFSGGGFHIFIAFKPIKLKHPRETFREFVAEVERELDLQTVDWQSIGDVKRVSKLPFTINQKRQRMCIPIDSKWSLHEILKQSKRCTTLLPVYFEDSGIADRLLEIDSRVKPEAVKPVKVISVSGDEEIEQLLEWAKTGRIKDGRHRLLFYWLIPRLIFSGYSNEESLEVCRKFIEYTGRKWEDYEKYCIYSLQRARERIVNGKPMKYRTSRFFAENPELIGYFMKEGGEGFAH